MKNAKDSFTSSAGIFLALVGSAVGLGNIWRFPYLMGEHGGAAFIIIYLFCAFVMAMPIMICEFVIGRRSRTDAVHSFEKLAPGTRWKIAGILGVVTSFVIISFYSVVGGWSVKYLISSFGASFPDVPATDLSFTYLFFIITILIVSFGIRKGVEKCSKVMMPVLFLLMIVFAVRSAFLPGAGAGLKYLFKPDFSAITSQMLIAALGQAFFSLSVGVGVVITYASYVDRNENILGMTSKTVIADTCFALIAGCAIMPAIFAFGFNPGEGPELVFVTLPQLFGTMPLGGIISVIFFFALVLAALSSSISMVEVITSFIINTFKITRRKAIIIISLPFLVTTTLNCLLPQVQNAFDYVSTNILMTAGSLLVVLFVGWKLPRETFADEITNSGATKIPPRLVNAIHFLIKYVTPVVILTIVLFAVIL